MEQPMIGVLPQWDQKDENIRMSPNYTRALEEAGAVPVILNLTTSETVLKRFACSFDGFLFPGGPDMHPNYFGQEVADYCGEICEMRDNMEAYMFREAVINQNKPALGICRGIQVFNIMLGGTLYQDIPTQLPSTINHNQEPPYDVLVHHVRLIPESPLYKLAGKEHLETNSMHHQGIDRLAKGLEVMATSDDGLIEAVYMPDHPFVWAVQWHPECAIKEEISKKIFSAFVEGVEKHYSY
jgi:putative glutamine amidotransferase